jgi:hypothetical protein
MLDLDDQPTRDRLAALATDLRSNGHREYAAAVDHALAGSLNAVALENILPGEMAEIGLATEMGLPPAGSPEFWLRVVREHRAEGGSLLDLSNPVDQDRLRGLAAQLAAEGGTEEAAQVYAYLGGADVGNGPGVLDFSNEFDRIESRNAAMSQEDAQAAQSARGHRALSAEDRLANSLDRIGRGTYQPRRTDLASPSASEAARQLAQARWGVSQPGPVTGQPNCSGSDEFGYCRGPFHDASCGSLADTQTAEALRETGAYRRLASQPFATQNGVWQDRSGGLMTLADHVEAQTGQRLRNPLFETGAARRGLAAPGSDPRYGDPDEPGRPGTPFPDDTADRAGAVRAAMGYTKRDAAAERARFTERRLQGALSQALSGRGVSRQPDFDVAARRQSIREAYGPPVPVQFGEGPVGGSLAMFEAG